RQVLGDKLKSEIGDQSDDQDIGQGAQAGFLAKRNPKGQDRQTDKIDHEPEAYAGRLRETFIKALVQNIPGIQAKVGADDHGDGDPIEDQAGEELDEATKHDTSLTQTGYGKYSQFAQTGAMISRIASPASLLRQLGPWRAEGGGPAYRQLADSVKLLIMDGRLSLAVRLPGERELAQALGLSRTTVSAAYARLRDEGFLSGTQGASVRTCLPSIARNRASDPIADPDRGVIDMTYAVLPAPPNVHLAYRRALERLPADLPGHG
ncbi:hypothetical protein LTR94_029144, partial [Friedmanniomyces endolithicus]